MKNLMTFTVFLVVVSLILGCNKTDSGFLLESKESKSNGFTISSSGEYLVFESRENFNELFDYLVNQEENFLDEWEQNNDFYSMRKFYNDLDEMYYPDIEITDPKDTLYSPIEDIYVATVLNPEGRIEINDTLFQITADSVYLYSASTGAFITSEGIQREIVLIEGEEGDGPVGNPYKMNNTASSCNYLKVSSTPWFFTENGESRRLIGRTYNVVIPFWMSYFGTTIIHKERVRYWFFGWKYRWARAEAGFLQMWWNVSWSALGFSHSDSDNINKWNAKSITKLHDYYIQFPIAPWICVSTNNICYHYNTHPTYNNSITRCYSW